MVSTIQRAHAVAVCERFRAWRAANGPWSIYASTLARVVVTLEQSTGPDPLWAGARALRAAAADLTDCTDIALKLDCERLAEWLQTEADAWPR